MFRLTVISLAVALSITSLFANGLNVLLDFGGKEISTGMGKDAVTYVGADFRLKEKHNGQTVSWSCEAADSVKGGSLTIEKDKSGNLIARVKRGLLTQNAKAYNLKATTNRNGKKVSKTVQVKVLTEPLRVMEWNIWGQRAKQKVNEPIDKGWHAHYHFGYEYKGKMTIGRDRIAEIIKQHKVDILGMQECYGNMPPLLKATGLKHPHNGGNCAILSRFKIDRQVTNSGGFASSVFEISPNRKFFLASTWFDYRQSDWMRDKKLTDEDGVKIEERRRLGSAKNVCKVIREKGFEENCDEVPIIITGDHNAISHKDYTEKTKGADQNHGRGVVNTPVTREFENNGYIDSFRFINPDPLKAPACSYSPLYNYMEKDGLRKKGIEFPTGRAHERVDYIYAKGKKLHPVASKYIETFDGKVIIPAEFDTTGKRTKMGIFVFPSDHGAFVTTYEWLD